MAPHANFDGFASLMVDFAQLSISFIYISISIAVSRTKDRGIHHFLELEEVKFILNNDSILKDLKRMMNEGIYYLHTIILIYGTICTATHFYMFGATIKRWTSKSKRCCVTNFPESTMIVLSLVFLITTTTITFDLNAFPDDVFGFYDAHANAYIYAVHRLQQLNKTMLFDVLTKFHNDTKCCGIYSPTEFILRNKIKSKSIILSKHYLSFVLFPNWRESIEIKNAVNYLPFAPSFCCSHEPPDGVDDAFFNFSPNSTCTFEFFSPSHAKVLHKNNVKPITPRSIFNIGCVKKSSYGIVSLLFLASLICTISTVVQIGSAFVRIFMPKTKSMRLQTDAGP